MGRRAGPDPASAINQLKAGGRTVIPVGLLDAQQLVVVDKDLNGKVTTKEIMPVLFSVLEDPTNLHSGRRAISISRSIEL
jgi:protein-L-isoaspartate O-methyltransferase